MIACFFQIPGSSDQVDEPATTIKEAPAPTSVPETVVPRIAAVLVFRPYSLEPTLMKLSKSLTLLSCRF